MSSASLLFRTVQRHPWSTALDLSVLAIMMISAFLLALWYDILEVRYELSPQPHITMGEGLALMALFCLGSLAFVARRAREEDRDQARWLEAKAEVREYRKLASLDPLTALPNRREFISALEAAVVSAGDRSHAVYLLDLNGFKCVNDECGHAEGDAILCAAAQRFRAAARSEDVVARLGGDEFAVLACGVDTYDEALVIGRRFVDALDHDFRVASRSYSVGVAIGVAFYPNDGRTVLDLMRHADVAMYMAKASKVSAVQFFSFTPTAAAGRTA